MMKSAKEVEHNLSRLAQKSRAVGIHIVVATQRPEVKVVTGLIKANLPCRIAFRVASRMDSRIVLDQNGAETLMGEGDMLFLPPGSSKLIRAQGTFVDDTELHNVIGYLRDQAEPDFHPELLRLRVQEVRSPEERDALFDDAARIILETRRGSVSLLQRRLGVGYARASRLIEQMADAGIVGHYKGSQAREVVMTLEDYEAQHDRELNADLDDDTAEPFDDDDEDEDEEEEEEEDEEEADYDE
jgi:S-DNA-T family DNA segregation ATPase FtsK/SpoIIIE